MKLGIFAKTFPGGIDENMAAVAAAGIRAVQYNLSIAGIDTVPEHIPPGTLDTIAQASTRHGVELAAISGTFNTAHPDPQVRAAGIARFPVLAAAAAELGIPVVTLSSGSRNPDDMWQHHPDNSTPQAWQDSRSSLEQLAVIAENTGVTIAFEPEHTNVVSTAVLARTMLDEVGSDRLKIVFDAANLLDTADLSSGTMTAVIDQALDLLGPDLALAHAKELVVGRAQVAPGEGVLPWQHIIDRLAAVHYTGAVVTHGLPAAGVPIAVDTLAPLIGAETAAANTRSV
ncbi:sugar phosphate isomerase/epimerase family protein [Rhodococcus koreensis]